MASWNQANGTSPSPFSFNVPPPPLPGSSYPDGASAGRPSQPQPRRNQASPLLTSLPSRREVPPAHSPFHGRSPNVPLNANGMPAFASQWSPADLLNPRGSHQAPRQKPENNIAYNNNNHSAPQLAFQFDSPGGTPPPSYNAHTDSSQSQQYHGRRQNGQDGQNDFAGYANGSNGTTEMGMGMGMAVPGMGNMLERMHNVADRTMVPQKRRKVYDDSSEQRRKPEFNGGSGSGVLGNYMREQREQGQQEAASRTTLVDISALDDEIEIVGDPMDKEVCYGRIEGADINAFRIPTPKPGAKAVSNGFWPQVKIVLRRKEGEKNKSIYAVDSTREIIGCLDVNTAIGIVPLLDSKFGIRTSCRILTRQRKENDPPAGTHVSCRYGLDLNLYGPKKYAMQIGRHLSQKQLWLRTPLFAEAGIPLYNPHTIERPPQSSPRPSTYASRQQGPARTTEEIRSDLIGMFDSLEKSEDLPEMDPDPRITTPLLKHQKQGLYFMTNKEKERVFSSDEKGNSSLWRLRIGNNGQKSYYNVITGQEERHSPPQILGGILADMMGLGKTLSILSLIVHTLDDEALSWAELKPSAQQYGSDLCQLKKGKNRLPKIEQTPLVRNCKTTLLVSPLSTIANWEDQIKQHIVLGTLKYYIYHGSNRIKDVNKLAEFDLVITTYGSVASEFGHRGKQKAGTYPLEEMNWFRIVLDEAHMIREQSTQQSKAICRLQASRRWAVTGTPVQNRLEDLGALMTFLRVKPFDERGGFAQYIMAPFKMCDPEILPKLRVLVDSITLRRLKDRIDLPQRTDHLVRLDFSDEERHVYDIFAKNAQDRVKVIVGQREKSLGGKAYVHILQSILRLRLICAHGRDLLNEEDLEVMNGLSKDSAIELDSDDEDDKPSLSPAQAYNMYNLMIETNSDICSSCTRKIAPNDLVDADAEAKDPIIAHMTPCFHLLCTACFGGYKALVEESAQGHQMGGCPMCGNHIKLSYFPIRQGGVEDEGPKIKSKGSVKHSKDLDNYGGPHTKTKALVSDLLSSKRESEQKPDEAPIKSVVFSGWTAHLDLIQLAFQENGLKFVRLDGKMSRTARAAAMDNFRDDPSIHVILVSITAGGLGLNLTAGNKVYVMEPQYNPAAEAQAVDRVHRLGQRREVVTVRYIMKDSFEEKMLELQEKKKKLASLSMDSDATASKRIGKDEAARKRLEDLRSLFK